MTEKKDNAVLAASNIDDEKLKKHNHPVGVTQLRTEPDDETRPAPNSTRLMTRRRSSALSLAESHVSIAMQEELLAVAGLHPEEHFDRFQKNSWQFGIAVCFFQGLFIILFGLFTRYEDRIWADIHLENDPVEKLKLIHAADKEISRSYGWFQDVHVMIIGGIGFLMTFLKRYSWSSLGFNFLFAAFAIQWGILVQGWFFESGHEDINDTAHLYGNISSLRYIPINLWAMIEAEFSTGTILISFGAVLGVASPVQCFVMIILEIVFYKLNAYICLILFKIADIGGSIVIHIFAAYFGISVARVLFKKGHIGNPAEGGAYHQDIFSLIGTIFLWIFWPSFNSIPGGEDDTSRYIAILNTYLGLCASCMMSYGTSLLVTPGRRITMEHVQNATLSGGVAMGAVAGMPIQPFGALIIGSFAGIFSTLSYSFLKPALSNAVNLHDTCGIHNLHGIPGLISGICSVIVCATGWKTDDFETGKEMALYQLAAIGVTLGISIFGGALTGCIMNIPVWDQLDYDEYFQDGKYWEMEVYRVPFLDFEDEEEDEVPDKS